MVIENGHFENQYIEEVAAYIRVSSTEQKMHGLSLEAQEKALETYANEHSMKIVEWYKDEGVSARKLIKKRPELQRMIQDAQKGRFRRIIFIKLDRYFRSVAEFHECQKILDEVNVTWTATEEKYDMATANGRAFVNMKLTIAELEADMAGERVRMVNEYKIKSGLPLFGNNCMPFCFEVGTPEHGERHKYIKKCDEEIMMELIAHVLVNHSVRAALLYVNNKFNRAFKYGTIMGALKNEMICGYYKGNPNYCPAFITRETFDKLQTIIKRNPRSSTNEHTYLFTGLIKCPECGCRMAGGMQVNEKNGKKYYYFNYRCNKHNRDKSCGYKKRPFENRVEQLLLDRFEEIIEEKRLASIEASKVSDRVSKYNIKELNEELERLNYSWQKGRIKSVVEYDKRYDELMEKIDAANMEKEEIASEPDYEALKASLAPGWKEAYKLLDDEHKRAFWRGYIDEIHVEWSKERKEIKNIEFLKNV